MDTYIGIMSGTSMDAIDVVAACFDDGLKIISKFSHEIPPGVKQRLLSVTPQTSIHDISELDCVMGRLFADSANKLIETHNNDSYPIKAIGCHGQTIYHNPIGATPNTIQIGDPNIITANTGYPVVADFRRKDMAFGGQGAPLVPAFHQHIFSSKEENRIALNIGGIANISLLPADGKTRGYDTGPGNTLMDLWIKKHLDKDYDKDGEWAANGTVIPLLLNEMLDTAYFQMTPPKSTGKELFNLEWLDKFVSGKEYAPQDVQTTLNQLTATTIADSILRDMPACSQLILCGGGAYNKLLEKNITTLLPNIKVVSSSEFGIKPELIEAAAFAWLARQRFLKEPGNLASVTGARTDTVLGAVYI